MEKTNIKPFTIYQTHEINFCFWERIKILFGKKVKVHSTIEIDREAKIIKGTGETVVYPFITIKPITAILFGEGICSQHDYK